MVKLFNHVFDRDHRHLHQLLAHMVTRTEHLTTWHRSSSIYMVCGYSRLRIIDIGSLVLLSGLVR